MSEDITIILPYDKLQYIVNLIRQDTKRHNNILTIPNTSDHEYMIAKLKVKQNQDLEMEILKSLR